MIVWSVVLFLMLIYFFGIGLWTYGRSTGRKSYFIAGVLIDIVSLFAIFAILAVTYS